MECEQQRVQSSVKDPWLKCWAVGALWGIALAFRALAFEREFGDESPNLMSVFGNRSVTLFFALYSYLTRFLKQ